jgi:hypothetical protein
MAAEEGSAYAAIEAERLQLSPVPFVVESS